MPKTHFPHGLTTIGDPTRVDSEALFELGSHGRDDNGREYIYVEADAAITAGMMCIIHGDFGAQGVTTALAAVGTGYGKLCGVAMAAMSAGQFGWLARRGTGADFLLDLNAAAVAFTRLRPTTTAGALDDTTTATEPYVSGVVITTASGGQEQEICILDNPRLELDLII